MRINKTYLKLGVALTAAFGFGFLVGRIYENWKTKRALEKTAKELKETMKEALIIEEPFEGQPKEKGDIDMTKRSKLDIYIDKTWKEGVDQTKKRMQQFLVEHEDGTKWDGMVRTILEKYGDKEYFVEDTTPWGCSMERPVVCMVFDKQERQLYWADGSFCGEPLNQADLDFIILAFNCFATYRQDDDGTRYPYISSTLENTMGTGLYMRHDDHVYVDNLRIVYLPTINREVWIRTVDKPDPEQIRHLLEEAINEFTQGGYDEEDWD